MHHVAGDSSGPMTNEIQRMRKAITDAAHFGGRMDGKRHGGLSLAPNLARSILQMGEVHGLSGEDTMTALAYYALTSYEEAMDKMLETDSYRVGSQFIPT